MHQLLSKSLLLIAVSLLAFVVVSMILRLVRAILFVGRKIVVLEMTPPAFKDKRPDANRMFLQALHGFGQSRTLREKFLGIQNYFSLEIVASKETGIRYLLRCSEKQHKNLDRIITTHMPEVIIKVVSDPLVTVKASTMSLLRIRQSAHYMYPLVRYERDDTHDPIGYVTGAMTKLQANEQFIYQVTISPRQLRASKKLRKKIVANENLIFEYHNRMPSLLNRTFGIINKLLFGLADTVSLVYHTDTQPIVTRKDVELQRKTEVAKRTRPERTLSYFEYEMVDEISKKLSLPLFKVAIRTAIMSNDNQARSDRMHAMRGALSLFNNEKLQKLTFKKYRNIVTRRYQLWLMKLGALGDSLHPCILSSEELASVYHFPHAEHSRTENVVQSLSKTLPAPISLKNGTKLDVLIGENHHHGQVTPIGLTEAERQRHMYVVGGTGNGKTTMLKYQIVQDIRNGKGLAVIDPHGDLAEELLGYIPEERLKDVIYINPDDLERPVGINLLELPKNLSGDELLREKDIVTESTVSVLRKIFSEDDSGGHRIEYVLRNTIQTALTMDEANLFTIFRLLNDAKFRKSVVNNLENEDLKIFWKNEIGKAGEMQKVKMAAGITAKIGRFLFSASAKKILEQNKSTIDFDRLMDEQKILICNFSKGLLGEDTSMLFGVTILAKIQLASLRRARQAQSDRKPFYLYVDEFQNFATMSFVQMLSESRKYKLFLIMAEQSTQQQDEQRLVDIVLANVGTVITFRTGSPTDERILLPLFRPFVEENELSNIPSYNFYARISAVNTQEPVSGTTCLLDINPDAIIARRIKDYSRNKYGFVHEENQIQIAPRELINPRQTRKKKLKKSPNLEQVIT
jgi:hypothetical protein